MLLSCASIPLRFGAVPHGSDPRLPVIKQVAWGPLESFEAARVRPDLTWQGNGCSAPQGMGLGDRKVFAARPACLWAAVAYHVAVRLRGSTRFAPGT